MAPGDGVILQREGVRVGGLEAGDEKTRDGRDDDKEQHEDCDGEDHRSGIQTSAQAGAKRRGAQGGNRKRGRSSEAHFSRRCRAIWS